jgi:hypothetical protein
VSDALQKAEAAVAKAENNTDVLAVAMAALELAKAAQQQPQHHGCQHDHQAPKQQPFDARKWWTIGGFAVVGGCVACALAFAFAMAAIAVAIGATCATGCLLVLRSMWRDYLNNR